MLSSHLCPTIGPTGDHLERVSIVATFVFPSVPDPIIGLRELGRACRPEGEIRLLEHMRARNEALGALVDLANPLAVLTTGANINRRTVDNGERTGLVIERLQDLSIQGIFKLIVARPGQHRGGSPIHRAQRSTNR